MQEKLLERDASVRVSLQQPLQQISTVTRNPRSGRQLKTESRSQQWLGQPRHLVVTHACDCSSEWVPSEWESDKNITAHQSITKHLEKTKDETCVQSVFRASMCPEVIQFNVSRRWERRGVLNSGQRYGNELWLGGNQSECRIPPLESMNTAL